MVRQQAATEENRLQWILLPAEAKHADDGLLISVGNFDW